jgi:anti-sigma B factor antagonist
MEAPLRRKSHCRSRAETLCWWRRLTSRQEEMPAEPRGTGRTIGYLLMGKTLKTRKTDDVVVIELFGRLMQGAATLLLRETIRRHLLDGNRKFIIDVGAVSHIDSAGLGEMVAAYTTIRSGEGDVKLTRLTVRVKDLLQMTKLLTVFDCFDDEASAVAAFKD